MQKNISRIHLCHQVAFPFSDSTRYRQGFTLIELLVVVLIIGILSAVALPQYEKAVLKSRVATVLPLTRAIYTAQEAYFLANNQYAKKFTDLDIAMPEGGVYNNDGNVLTYSNGRKFNLCLACNSIQGYPGASLPFYIEFYYNGGKYCWAGKNSKSANDICKNLSGTGVVSGTTTNDNGYLLHF